MFPWILRAQVHDEAENLAETLPVLDPDSEYFDHKPAFSQLLLQNRVAGNLDIREPNHKPGSFTALGLVFGD